MTAWRSQVGISLFAITPMDMLNIPGHRSIFRVLFTPHPEGRVLINDGAAPWDSPV